MPPQFSIVIPTRNRKETLVSSLQTCLSQTFDDYEIVIHDNSDGDETQVYITHLLETSERAKRLVRYFKNDVSVAMTANFELAVGRSTGNYVIVLGDDDGILPRCLEEVNLLLEITSMKVIKWANALYTWPNISVPGSANYLGFSIERSYRLVNGIECISECLRKIEYVDLPLLYINAAISRETIDEIRRRTGSVFGSRSPDVYSGFAIAYICGQFASTTVPLTIAGLSRSSNGTASLFGGANATPVKDFNALNALSGEQGFSRHPHVPDLGVYPTQVVAECFLTVKERLFPDDNRLDFPRDRILRETAMRVDVAQKANADDLRFCAAGDRELEAVVEDLISNPIPQLAKPRLRPELLGADGTNLHVDAADFGIENIEEAVAFVHHIVWPANAPLRYDLGNSQSHLVAMSDDLIATRQLLIERTNQGLALANDLAQTRDILIERTDLSATLSRELIERTSRLEAALVEQRKLTDQVAELKAQNAMLKSKHWK